MEGLEFWQAGHYGPICKGLLKKRDGTSSAVVVKTLRGTEMVLYEDLNDVTVKIKKKSSAVAICLGMLWSFDYK